MQASKKLMNIIKKKLKFKRKRRLYEHLLPFSKQKKNKIITKLQYG